MDEGEPVVHVHKLVYQIKAGLTKWQVGHQSSTTHLHVSLKGRSASSCLSAFHQIAESSARSLEA